MAVIAFRSWLAARCSTVWRKPDGAADVQRHARPANVDHGNRIGYRHLPSCAASGICVLADVRRSADRERQGARSGRILLRGAKGRRPRPQPVGQARHLVVLDQRIRGSGLGLLRRQRQRHHLAAGQQRGRVCSRANDDCRRSPCDHLVNRPTFPLALASAVPAQSTNLHILEHPCTRGSAKA
jgi:hypothetical protein